MKLCIVDVFSEGLIRPVFEFVFLGQSVCPFFSIFAKLKWIQLTQFKPKLFLHSYRLHMLTHTNDIFWKIFWDHSKNNYCCKVRLVKVYNSQLLITYFMGSGIPPINVEYFHRNLFKYEPIPASLCFIFVLFSFQHQILFQFKHHQLKSSDSVLRIRPQAVWW